MVLGLPRIVSCLLVHSDMHPEYAQGSIVLVSAQHESTSTYPIVRSIASSSRDRTTYSERNSIDPGRAHPLRMTAQGMLSFQHGYAPST